MDPLHPKICITYSPELVETANRLANKYRHLGAEVITFCEENYKKVRHCKGKLLYFSKSPGVASIAKSLAKDVNKIQTTTPRFVSVKEYCVDFMIYFVATPAVPKNRQPNVGSDLVPCPICDDLVRPNRLERHLQRTHQAVRKSVEKVEKSSPTIRLVRPKRRKRLGYVAPPRGSPFPSGAPRLSGWSSSVKIKHLKPREGPALCRICGSALTMYNSRECYTCNPK